MATSLFDSAIFSGLLSDSESASLFSDEAYVASLVDVEIALAKVQGELNVIPLASAKIIEDKLIGIKVSPEVLTKGTTQSAVPIPALVEYLRDSVGESQHASYIHWGATSQDIIDTALCIRLQSYCDNVDSKLGELLDALAEKASLYAETPVAARTRRQIATPTSFGAIVATWGVPFLSYRKALANLRPELLKVSLAGASGNLSAMGSEGAAVRRALAVELGLADSKFCWHSDRSTLAEFSSLLNRITASLAKIAEDFLISSSSEVGELQVTKGGGSSTMPQKQNPVAAEVISSLFQISNAQNNLMSESVVHRQQRDGVSWMIEWYALPQVCLATGQALRIAIELIKHLEPNTDRMLSNITNGNGLIFAEAVSFKLATCMTRAEAQDQVKDFCNQAIENDIGLSEVAQKPFPEIDWNDVFDPRKQWGNAPQQAQEFARQVEQEIK